MPYYYYIFNIHMVENGVNEFLEMLRKINA